jgi:rSAM/selenodomain-associated transferase 1
MTGTCRVVVFAKAPVAGFAKTRLIPALGPDGAAALAQRLLEHAVRQALDASVGPVELCAAPDTQHVALQALAANGRVALTAQGDGDLGARMARAFGRGLAPRSPLKPSSPAVDQRPCMLLIGTDAPGVDANYLRAAATALAAHDAVFGPALDGGYTLVGLREATPALFTHMPWSTAQVMSETRRRLALLGLRHAELPALSDIDEPADLAALPPGW